MGKLLKDLKGLVGTAIKIADRADAARRKRAPTAAGTSAKKKKPKAAPKRPAKVTKRKKRVPKSPVIRKTPVRKRAIPARLQPLVQPAAAWQAYRADDFFQHGRAGENDYRTSALNAAQAAGLDCIRCRVSFGMSDELGMHLVKLEHPERPGYFLGRDGWFFQARQWNVTRWQHDLGTPSQEQVVRWLWLTKSYTKDELQYIVTRATPQEAINLLKANKANVTVVIE
jgi:hypothetical protein